MYRMSEDGAAVFAEGACLRMYGVKVAPCSEFGIRMTAGQGPVVAAGSDRPRPATYCPRHRSGMNALRSMREDPLARWVDVAVLVLHVSPLKSKSAGGRPWRVCDVFVVDESGGLASIEVRPLPLPRAPAVTGRAHRGGAQVPDHSLASFKRMNIIAVQDLRCVRAPKCIFKFAVANAIGTHAWTGGCAPHALLLHSFVRFDPRCTLASCQYSDVTVSATRPTLRHLVDGVTAVRAWTARPGAAEEINVRARGPSRQQQHPPGLRAWRAQAHNAFVQRLVGAGPPLEALAPAGFCPRLLPVVSIGALGGDGCAGSGDGGGADPATMGGAATPALGALFSAQGGVRCGGGRASGSGGAGPTSLRPDAEGPGAVETPAPAPLALAPTVLTVAGRIVVEARSMLSPVSERSTAEAGGDCPWVARCVPQVDARFSCLPAYLSLHRAHSQTHTHTYTCTPPPPTHTHTHMRT